MTAGKGRLVKDGHSKGQLVNDGHSKGLLVNDGHSKGQLVNDRHKFDSFCTEFLSEVSRGSKRNFATVHKIRL